VQNIPVLKHLQYVHNICHFSLLMKICNSVQIAENSVINQAIVMIVTKELEGHLSILQIIIQIPSVIQKH
jgi:hypothetical protein